MQKTTKKILAAYSSLAASRLHRVASHY